MLLLYALSSLLALVTAAPTPGTTDSSCHAKVFDIPWTLSNIQVYQAAGQGSGNVHASISFHFCDVNEGLQMETECSGTIINDRCEEENGGYVACANNTVNFKVASNLIMMNRAYLDDCLGPVPWNSGRAFGENNTEMASTSGFAGTTWSQDQMLVHITAMT